MKVILYLCTLIYAQGLLANTSYFSRSDSLSEDGYEFGFENNYFQSSSSVDLNGNKVLFSDEEKYSSNDSIFRFKYGLSSNIDILSHLIVRLNQSAQESGAEIEKLNALGAESFWVGALFSSDRSGGFQYGLRALYKFALYSNDSYDPNTASSEIVLGDDGAGYYVGGILSYLTPSNNFFELELAYRKPGSTISNEIISQSQITFAWRPVSLIFGLDYVLSLKQDTYSDDPNNKPQISTGNTFLFNSINRSYTEPFIGLNFKMGNTWRLESRLAQRVSGLSTDLGTKISFSLLKRISNTNNFKNKNNSFKQYEIEGVVTKITKTRKALLVDKGVSDGLKQGNRVDFYHFDFLDGDELIGTGIVIKSGYDKSIVKVLKKYSKRKIKEGTVVRSGLIR